MRKLFLTFIAALLILPATTYAAGEKAHPPAQDWDSRGIFGAFDKQAAQRGMQVFKEVCAACHSLNLVAFRHLQGLGYDENQIKVFASEFEITDGPNEDGEFFTRPGVPADYYPNPYSNEVEARLANNGALPPDMSLIVKSRAHGRGNFFINLAEGLMGGGSASGSDYVYALLTGYEQAPDDMVMQDGMSYNKWFPSHQIAMPVPLTEGQVEYSDGTEATVEQMSRDVTVFLAWAAEPELEQRRSLGFKTIIFLLILLAFTIGAKKAIWSRVKK